MEEIHKTAGDALKKEMLESVLTNARGIPNRMNRGLPFPEDQTPETVERFGFPREKRCGAGVAETLFDYATVSGSRNEAERKINRPPARHAAEWKEHVISLRPGSFVGKLARTIK